MTPCPQQWHVQTPALHPHLHLLDKLKGLQFFALFCFVKLKVGKAGCLSDQMFIRISLGDKLAPPGIPVNSWRDKRGAMGWYVRHGGCAQAFDGCRGWWKQIQSRKVETADSGTDVELLSWATVWSHVFTSIRSCETLGAKLASLFIIKFWKNWPVVDQCNPWLITSEPQL